MTRNTIQPVTAQDVRRRAIGMLGGASFGGVWAAWAALGLPGRHDDCTAFFSVAALAILTGLVVATIGLLRIARHADLPQATGSGQRRHARRGYLLILVAEIVAMNIAAWALYPHHMNYLVPAIALVVGLHFFPLGALLRQPHLRIAALAMSAAALASIAALALGLDGATVDFLLDTSCALALWAACFVSWRSIRRQLAAFATPRTETREHLPAR